MLSNHVFISEPSDRPNLLRWPQMFCYMIKTEYSAWKEQRSAQFWIPGHCGDGFSRMCRPWRSQESGATPESLIRHQVKSFLAWAAQDRHVAGGSGCCEIPNVRDAPFFGWSFVSRTPPMSEAPALVGCHLGHEAWPCELRCLSSKVLSLAAKMADTSILAETWSGVPLWSGEGRNAISSP